MATRDAFNRAADALEGWRVRQKASLDATARLAFEAIRKDTDRRKRELAAQIAENRERMVEDEKARLLLQRPGLALRMLPSRMMRESLAYFKAADLVRRSEARLMLLLERECQEREDEFLREQEREREARQRTVPRKARSLRDSFERSAGRDDDGRSR